MERPPHRGSGAPWWVALLVRLYPSDFREARGAEIEEFVDRALAETPRERRGWVSLRLGADLVGSALRMRGRVRLMGTIGEEGWTMGFVSDARSAIRGLGRSPAFAFIVVLTLGLGIGLNTAVFSVVNSVLLRPLDFDPAGRLVYVQARREAENTEDALVSGGDWRVLRDGMSALASLEAVGSVRQTLTGAGLPRQVQVGWASPGFLSMLGVEPALGRLMTEDDPPGTAVVSHALWDAQLGRDPKVLGSTVQLDGNTYTVVGVLPAGFRLDLPSRGGRLPVLDIWKNPDGFWQNGDVWSERGPEFGMLRLVGALEAGASIATAQSQADAALRALSEEDSRYSTMGFGVTVHDLHRRLVSDVRSTLLLLMGAVGLVLLIACGNVANLLLVRANGRIREMAVRVAIGASRSRVARFLLAESLVLALAGSALGLVIASGFLRVMPLLAPGEIPRLDGVTLDGSATLFAVLAAVAVTLLVGVMPAVVASRAHPASALGNARASGGAGGRTRDGLVVAQVALSLVLLVGAGLLVSSLARMNRVDLGIEADDLFSFAVSIPGADYGWPEEAGQYYRAVQDRVAALPGVTSAGVVWPVPFGGSWGGEYAPGGASEYGVIPYYLATEEYFPTAGIPLVDGRLFRDGDPTHTVVLSEAAAESAFPGQSAVGRIVQANPWGRGPEDYQVIGVVGDVLQNDLRTPTEGGVYFDARAWSWVDWEVHIVARTDVPHGTLVPAIRAAVAELDDDVPVARIGLLAEGVARETATAQFVLALLTVFAAAAVLLAVVGLYGVVSYSVGLRRRELGIRMALGSARTGIEAMVVRHGLTVAGVGVLIGVAASVATGRILEAYLYQVEPGDPLTLAGAALLMGAAAAGASWLPARRAGKTSPVEILKAE